MSHESTEPTYTLEQAAKELRRRQCVEHGHEPAVHIVTLADPMGTYYCECGEYRWVAQRLGSESGTP